MTKAAEIIDISRKPSPLPVKKINGKKPTAQEINNPELVDEMVKVKLELDELKKTFKSLQDRAKKLARQEWNSAVDSGLTPSNVKFTGNAGSANVSAKFIPLKDLESNRQEFIEKYSEEAYNALFSESVIMTMTSTPEEFIDAAIEAGLDVDKFFNIQTTQTPVDGCFSNLIGLSLPKADLEEIEANLYAHFKSPSCKVTPKK